MGRSHALTNYSCQYLGMSDDWDCPLSGKYFYVRTIADLLGKSVRQLSSEEVSTDPCIGWDSHGASGTVYGYNKQQIRNLSIAVGEDSILYVKRYDQKGAPTVNVTYYTTLIGKNYFLTVSCFANQYGSWHVNSVPNKPLPNVEIVRILKHITKLGFSVDDAVYSDFNKCSAPPKRG